jgi:hypothetical protein
MKRPGLIAGAFLLEIEWERSVPIPLAAPTRVAPAPATEQKQHQENNQYGFHVVTSLMRGSWTGLCNGRFTSSLCNMIELDKTKVCSH